MWPHESFRRRRLRLHVSDRLLLFVIGFAFGAAFVVGLGWF